MSSARWCDYGDHAYKAGRPGTIMLGQLVEAKLDMYGMPARAANNIEQEVAEMCPECAAELGLIRDYNAPLPPAQRKAELLNNIKEKGRATK